MPLEGPKLNLEVSLSGRYLVYIPSNDRITISNRLQNEEERFRLKKIVKSLVGNDCGIIIRTEAQGCTQEELEKDKTSPSSADIKVIENQKQNMIWYAKNLNWE